MINEKVGFFNYELGVMNEGGDGRVKTRLKTLRIFQLPEELEASGFFK